MDASVRDIRDQAQTLPGDERQQSDEAWRPYVNDMATQLRPPKNDMKCFHHRVHLPDPCKGAAEDIDRNKLLGMAGALRNRPINYLCWHYDPKLVDFWRKNPSLAGSKSGMPPCPYCHDQPLLQRGTVTANGFSNTVSLIISLGGPEFSSCMQYICKGCPMGESKQ
jgi:hypothetical protein